MRFNSTSGMSSLDGETPGSVIVVIVIVITFGLAELTGLVLELPGEAIWRAGVLSGDGGSDLSPVCAHDNLRVAHRLDFAGGLLHILPFRLVPRCPDRRHAGLSVGGDVTGFVADAKDQIREHTSNRAKSTASFPLSPTENSARPMGEMMATLWRCSAMLRAYFRRSV